MRKIKSFNVGDKVFAKVKGYPAWPAKIVGANGKKYDVTFYGTRETGSIKVEDLFYYLKHKDQFCKNLKRKDYIEAVEQIEAEIQETGTDGNVESKNIDAEPSITGVTEKKGKKRKRSDSADKTLNNEDTPTNKKLGKRNSLSDVSEKVPEPEHNVDTKLESQGSESSESLKAIDVSLKNVSNITSRSGRVIKLKKFSDDENGDVDKKLHKRRKSAPLDIKDEFGKDEAEKIDTKGTKRRTSLESQESQEESSEVSKEDPTEVKSDEDKDDKQDVTMEDNKVEETDIKVVDGEVQEKGEEGGKTLESESVEKLGSEDSSQEESSDPEVPDVNIVSVDYLKTVIAYADHVRSKSSIYKKMPVEPRENLDNQVLVAKLPSGKLVGIKYKSDGASKADSEFDKAESDEFEAKTLLSLKDLVEEGSCQPNDDASMFMVDINMDELDVQERNEIKILEHKKRKLKCFTEEASLVDYDTKIKACLGLDKAEPKKALEYLEAMNMLEIEPLMLKKHPLIVDMVKRLRRYVGNVKEWKLTEESLRTFEADAHKIRLKAEEVFTKFKSLIKARPGMSFWDAFSAEVEQFKEEIKDMKEGEKYELWSEPYSRLTFFDLYEERQKQKEIENNQEKQEKETPSETTADTKQLTDIVETST